MSFYDEMALVAQEVLTEFKQGIVTLRRPSTPTPGANTWDSPTPAAPTDTPLNATVSGVTSRYIDGETIFATDLVVTFPALDATPAKTDMLVVNGKPAAIKQIIQIPASGTPVAYKVIIEG